MGHSLGGVIVSALAVEHPALVRAVVSVDPGYLLPEEYPPDRARAWRGAVQSGDPIDGLADIPVRQLLAGYAAGA